MPTPRCWGSWRWRLLPPEPQLQHAALRVTARGWETLPLSAPDGSGALVVALDLPTPTRQLSNTAMGASLPRRADAKSAGGRGHA